MKLLFFGLMLMIIASCGGHKNLNDYANYVEVISNVDSTINELSATSDSMELNHRLNARFQSFSENKNLVSKIPNERIQEKALLWEECIAHFDSCEYLPEGYLFNTKRNFLNLRYQYNLYGSHDLFYKNGVIDLSNGHKLTHSTMFKDPIRVLEMYNAKYVQEYEDYLERLSSNELSEDDQEEYDIIRNHLETRSPFKLSDLDNLELIYDSKKDRFTEVLFHYNGAGGVYKAILAEGYISFTLKELDKLLLKDFKNQLGKI